MSLIRQLWIAIILIMTLAFGGSFAVSTLLAKQYLQEQLYLKNLDNANSLALSISQMPKEPVSIELMLSAQFDTGHYEYIRLTDPSGSLMLERANPPVIDNVPAWFVGLIDLSTAPGIAQIQDGWHQFGTLTLASHGGFAYQSLWQGALRLLLWFLAGAVVTGLLGSLALRFITRPLGDVVEQAEAIGARRFITIDEPKTLELRTLVGTMNALSNRVRTMLADEAARLEQLRRAAQHDSLTGLLNRDEFLRRAEAVLSREDKSAAGVLVMARLKDLARINQALGRELTDQLLGRMGESLTRMLEARSGWFAARLNGSDFALFAPEENDAQQLGDSLIAAISPALAGMLTGEEVHLPVGATDFVPEESLSRLLARVDGALAAAEQGGMAGPRVVAHDQAQPASDLGGWRSLLENAMNQRELRLASFPVIDSRKKLLHYEAPLRMRIDGSWQAAGVFMPWVARLGLLPKLDAQVVELALQTIAAVGKPLGVNISAEALSDAAFRAETISRLQQAPQLASQLWLEVPEAGAYRHLAAFRALCLALKPLGCKIGLEHVGHHFSQLGALHDLGLDYIKIDASIIRDIEGSPGNQAIVRGLCMIAHSIGLMAIAEGVKTAAERDNLPDLGVDGMTGPGIDDVA